MLKTVMTEYEMENYLFVNGFQVTDGECVFDSTKVIDEAIKLGYEGYMLDGDGELNQTLIFISREMRRDFYKERGIYYGE